MPWPGLARPAVAPSAPPANTAAVHRPSLHGPLGNTSWQQEGACELHTGDVLPASPPPVFQGLQPGCQTEVPNFQFHGFVNKKVPWTINKTDLSPWESHSWPVHSRSAPEASSQLLTTTAPTRRQDRTGCPPPPPSGEQGSVNSAREKERTPVPNTQVRVWSQGLT